MQDHQGHGLGRLVSPKDVRDGNYPATRLMSRMKPSRKYKKWYADVIHIDQGAVGSCTAASLAHVKHDGPFTHRPYWVEKPAFDVEKLYCRAQDLDGQPRTWCSARYDTGATMRSAGLAAREGGWIDSFWWFTDFEAALTYLTNDGVLWAGTWWYSSMSNPAPEDGMIQVDGRREGGHAFKVDEISWTHEYIGGKNTWGLDWGRNGRFRMSFSGFERLHREQGELLAIAEQRVQ